MTTPRRIPELEGLRGLLSWWVVAGHALTHAGYSHATLGRGWRILAQGEYAVDVFIILSGFVIHKLWHDSREPYRIFIARRFLRLWPAYFVCLVAALALWPSRAGVVFHDAVGIPELVAQGVVNWQHEHTFYWWHVAAHLPMLQRAVPETHLPGSAIAFLGPAWSISLEWQFYLVAPLLFAALARYRSAAWTAFAVVAGLGWMMRYTPPFNLWFPMEGFLPQKLLLFGVGILSHELWRAFRDYGPGVAPALLGLAVLVLFFTLSLPLAIWIAVMAVALSRHNRLKRFLDSPVVQFLGRVSYSTYLGHMLVIWSLQALAFSWVGNLTSARLLALFLGVGTPLILLLSAALHRWVEMPGIALGRRLKQR